MLALREAVRKLNGKDKKDLEDSPSPRAT